MFHNDSTVFIEIVNFFLFVKKKGKMRLKNVAKHAWNTVSSAWTNTDVNE